MRMTLNGVEVAAKISGKAAERLAVLLYAVLKDQKKTRGKTRLNSMLRSGKELKVFAIGDRDLEKFCREAKKYGILYCVLKDKTANDGHTDVFVRAEDASKINRIFDRFGIATADIGSARTEIVKAKEEQKNADIPVPDRSTTEKDKEEAFLDALLAPAPNKEEAQTQNPTQGPAAKSRPSEPTSNQREKTVRGISDPTERARPSVRQEMKEIREANYDDIFNASAQKGTEDKSFVSFNKEEWAAQKKQERESAFAMIDETAQRMANDGSLFQSYLDVQARFDRYSVGNAVLITAQKADVTQLSDFKGWKNNGVFIKKGESGIVLLEPGEEYTKEDGTVGVSYNSKKVFDISQTTAKAKDRPAMKRDERLLLKAIIHNAPCPIEISQKLPENINAVYRPDDKKIYVRPGLEAGDIFRGISQELAHAHLDDGAHKRSDHAFTAYCVSYVLCSRYNVPKDMFRFDRLPEGFSTMDARSVRNELSKIRDVANEISSDMAKVLDKSMKPKERRDEAR